MSDEQSGGNKRPATADRSERLAAALRVNLRRRKEQARNRAASPSPPGNDNQD